VSSYVVRGPDGDPEYLAGALERAERGLPLRRVDLDELSAVLGREQARRVARDVDAWSRARDRWAGPHQRAPLPFPPALARLIAHLRAGRGVSVDDVRGLAGRAARRMGRRTLRRTARTLGRTTASRARTQARRTRGTRGGRPGRWS